MTTALGEASRLLGGLGRADGVWRAGLEGSSPETERGTGSVWVHAASLGEVGAARPWIEALLRRGYRPPFLLTTRTQAGLSRARQELGDRAAARIAPHDFPQTVASFLDAACPWRLDLIETELWPNLIMEAQRRRVAVVFVGATVSGRTAGRLRSLGIAGPSLLGEGVFVLAQSEPHAGRFERLGVPRSRIAVIGDLKADAPPDPLDPRPFGSRPALVFGSLRPGEEGTARLLAQALEDHRSRFGRARTEWARSRSERDPFEGRSRALLVIAPRHKAGELRVRASFAGRGFELHVREKSSQDSSLDAWIDGVAARPGPRVALLATRGELPALYARAWGAVVGGTFAPKGGHNAWEPAARGCPVIVGPHYAEVATAVDAIRAEGGGVVAAGERHLRSIVAGWLADEDLESRGLGAHRAARNAAGAAARGADVLDAWGLAP